MRQTFTQLKNTAKDYISKSSGSFAVSTVDNFIGEHINKRYSDALATLRDYQTQWPPRTASTVADQQFYYNPPDLMNIESVTVEVGGVKYPLIAVNSPLIWNALNQIDFSGTTIPQYFHPRRDDFGIYPTPTADGNTITVVGNLRDVEMTQEDETTGTVDATNGDQTISGSGTSFTADMAGDWFQAGDGDKRWYRIGSVTSSTELELEQFYQGTDVTGSSFIIGESPEIPPEIHAILPHGAAADFYSGPKKDLRAAQGHNNYFWTGDFNNPLRDPNNATGGVLGAVNRYSTRSNDTVIYKDKHRVARFNEAYTTVLTS